MTVKQVNSREEIAQWSNAQLFAYAMLHGFSNAQETRASPGKKLSYSFCYGCGYSDTKFWTIPYNVDDSGFPVFDGQAKETLTMLLVGEHLTTWNELQAIKDSESKASNAHKNFMAT